MATDKSQSLLHARVLEVLELIRPSIQLDGGDIELVSVDEHGVVSIRFLGACIGCPSSDMTLQHGIEKRLMERIEDVSAVRVTN